MDGTQLLMKGLRWSYRKYGAKGVAGFLVVGLVGYLLYERKLRAVVTDGESTGAADEGGTAA